MSASASFASAEDRPETAVPPSRGAIVALCAISKSFGPTLANDSVDLSVAPGDVIGLVGGNGAGKSTLMRILGGITAPDGGVVEIDGQPLARERYGPIAAQARGIRVVHQELSLCSNLSVAENFFLESPDAARPLPGWRRAYRQRAHRALDTVFPDHRIDVDARVGHLPIGQRQMVEIARAAAAPAVRVLVLDEPTSSLGLARSLQLQAFVRERARQGLAFVFISHKLHEITQVATRIVVMRNGRIAWAGEAAGASVPMLVEVMGGDAERALREREGRVRPKGEVLARIAGDAVQGLGHEIALCAGEVVGLAGLDGSGQKEFLHRLFEAPRSAAHGIEARGETSFISGDRQHEGVFPLWDVLGNICISRFAKRPALSAVSDRAERAAVREPIARLRLDPERLSSDILDLSGGNQQKALVARAFVSNARIILLDDPTRGVDVAAKADFYALVDELARGDRLVVWHSTEDNEFLEADRVLVFGGGRVARELAGPEISEEAIVDASFAAHAGASKEASPDMPARSAWLDRLVKLVPFVTLGLVFAIMTSVNPATASAFGLDLLLGPAVALVLVALGQMFIVGGSEIDLGAGAFAGLTNVLSATLLVDQPGVGAACLIAAVVGYGLLAAAIQARKIPAIVVTLGASFIWSGIGYTLQPTPGGSSPAWLSSAFGWSVPGVPTSLLIILIAATAAFLIDKAPLGVVLRAFGNNPTALARGGWPAFRYGIIRYLIAGSFGLLAGLSLTAANSASDINAGSSFTLLSVAAVVMGGCSLGGGIVSVLGVVAGAVTLALIGAFLGAVDVSTDYNAAVQGLVLLAMLVLRTTFARREQAT
jgi:ribose transport system ATP-binding protein